MTPPGVPLPFAFLLAGLRRREMGFLLLVFMFSPLREAEEELGFRWPILCW